MEIQNISIDEISPYENNPRINEDAVEGTAESIKEFGWQQPIVVDKNNVVIVGHTRLKAAKELKLKEVPVLVADKLTDQQVKAYRLADNKTGDMAIWDNKKLLDELDGIEDDIFTGFTESDTFDDTFDETDSEFLDEDKSAFYKLNFETESEDLFNKVQKFIEDNGGEIK
ncbi:ParB N-terminal domain-containing protein [Companilactobacillus mishanensis]|uniref:Chromosome partitioning protein ParB n=1 Tax=Companilactobacillus mishanensis TaxID=2486008 RepID=A0A5P0ZF75_9LACO|nr:ParB N-terminal domain-containing protein [Companilactobacillus mishanensis]MQS44258.1 chromosome partitioning protein ParB [Companilactobacillus mishanensis]MQS51639.1 chromosome partitioning protein ParB [Companilactobacillus mishanensis]